MIQFLAIFLILKFTLEKNTPTRNLGKRTVLDLTSGLENKGHTIYMDSFYTSVDLFREMESKMFGCSGTIRKNRKGLPPELKKKKKIEKGESIYSRSGNLISLRW